MFKRYKITPRVIFNLDQDLDEAKPAKDITTQRIKRKDTIASGTRKKGNRTTV